MDEKVLETTIEALLNRVQDLKNSCQTFLIKIEQQQLTWPQLLDNFAVISGQVSTLFKILKVTEHPFFVILFSCLFLFNKRQIQSYRISEGRIHAFNHEVVPDHLRTKYEPDVEEKEAALSEKTSAISDESTQRQISDFNAMLSHVLDMIGTMRDEWDADQVSAGKPSTAVNTDVSKLVGAVTYGKGLSSSSSSSSSHKSSSQGRHSSSQRSSSNSSGKVSSSVKTDLKTKVIDAGSPYGAK